MAEKVKVWFDPEGGVFRSTVQLMRPGSCAKPPMTH